MTDATITSTRRAKRARGPYLGLRAARRPAPAFAHLLGTVAGAFAFIAMIAFVVAATDTDPQVEGIIGSLLLMALAIGVGIPEVGALRSAGTTALVLTVPSLWLFAFFASGSAPERGDVRLFLALTTLSYAVLYLLLWTRGRAVFLAGTLVVFISWLAFELAGDGGFGRTSFGMNAGSNPFGTGSGFGFDADAARHRHPGGRAGVPAHRWAARSTRPPWHRHALRCDRRRQRHHRWRGARVEREPAAPRHRRGAAWRDSRSGRGGRSGTAWHHLDRRDHRVLRGGRNPGRPRARQRRRHWRDRAGHRCGRVARWPGACRSSCASPPTSCRPSCSRPRRSLRWRSPPNRRPSRPTPWHRSRHLHRHRPPSTSRLHRRSRHPQTRLPPPRPTTRRPPTRLRAWRRPRP